MSRLDSYDILPQGMREYLSFNDFHFSKPMYRWAVSMMTDRNGKKAEFMEKDQVMDVLKRNSVTVEKDMGYDIPYVYAMARSDYFGSSITDEAHLAKFVKDYIDDPDGYETRAFDEFLAKLNAKGVSVPWEDLL